MNNINIGIQLYSVKRQIDEYGVDTVFAALRDAGCNTVEFAGFYGLTPTEMKEKLEKYGLRPLAAHIKLDAIEENLPYIDELGISRVYIPSYPIELLRDEAGYSEFIEKVHTVKKILDGRGVAFGYHNHHREYENGSDVVYKMISDVENFTSELDIFWAKAAGHEPCELIKKYGKNLSALHIKDMDKRADPKNPREYPNAVIGEGQCDTEAAFMVAYELGVDTYILEVEDYPSEYTEYIRKSCENIKKYYKKARRI